MTGRVLFLAQILEVDEINPENFMDLFPRRHPPLMFVPRALMGNFLFHRIMGNFSCGRVKYFVFITQVAFGFVINLRRSGRLLI